VFLSGTLLNAATVVIGATVGLAAASRVGERLRESLTAGLGLFTAAIAVQMTQSMFVAPARQGDSLAVVGGILLGVVVGEWLRLHDRLEALGAWFQARLERGGRTSPVAEAFVTTSLLFCVGPMTVLGAFDNGLRGDITLLATKSVLDGVSSIAFAAALGPGVYLSAATVLVVQGTFAAGAFLLRDVLDARTVAVVTGAGGVILIALALRLLDLKAIRVANFLPALLIVPILLRAADAISVGLGV
jgi:uncharacterized membrane protein YqgA involved in biofilm formation